jgi:hypothetical protein
MSSHSSPPLVNRRGLITPQDGEEEETSQLFEKVQGVSKTVLDAAILKEKGVPA